MPSLKTTCPVASNTKTFHPSIQSSPKVISLLHETTKFLFAENLFPNTSVPPDTPMTHPSAILHLPLKTKVPFLMFIKLLFGLISSTPLKPRATMKGERAVSSNLTTPLFRCSNFTFHAIKIGILIAWCKGNTRRLKYSVLGIENKYLMNC